ncbi:hypothetical protein PVK06_012694 [Gossypium arboreum]|uniref:Uncharacterized protein n=1 Tax=Gossypium arboreum TaxID=29729 RepID=A0ABR0QC55_GOSAR|nr:hypothetical protein PVK06_012694 [Gossypium arboreum]
MKKLANFILNFIVIWRNPFSLSDWSELLDANIDAKEWTRRRKLPCSLTFALVLLSFFTDRMIEKAADIFAVAANEIKTNVPNSIPTQWRKLMPGSSKQTVLPWETWGEREQGRPALWDAINLALKQLLKVEIEIDATAVSSSGP